jgi:hypothetical protein
MLGATHTAIGPDVAPTGIVILIEAALQELIVTGLLFSATTLDPCVAPKFAPVITTELPTDPVVADTPVITGAGTAVELTDTLSSVAVASAVALPLVTPRPIYTPAAIVIVWLPPSVQYTPSGEVYALNVFPLRTTFSQYGNGADAMLAPELPAFPPVVSL